MSGIASKFELSVCCEICDEVWKGVFYCPHCQSMEDFDILPDGDSYFVTEGDIIECQTCERTYKILKKSGGLYQGELLIQS